MLLGNTRSFAIELLPVQPWWPIRYPAEEAGWAGVAIWLGGRNICAHIHPGGDHLRSSLHIPLGPVADWLIAAYPAIEYEERAALFPTTHDPHEDLSAWAEQRPGPGLSEDDWFDAREAWWLRHFLPAGADGSRVPNLAFARQDEQLLCSWGEPFRITTDAPRFVYESGLFRVPWSEGKGVLGEFVEEVARLIAEAGGTHFAWVETAQPLESAEPSLTRALELLTGRSVESLSSLFEAGELSEVLNALGLTAADSDPAASPQSQVLRDLSPSLGPGIGDALRGLHLRSADASEATRASWHRGREVALDAARAGQTPEQSGQLAASEVRAQIGLDGQPVQSTDDVLGAFGTRLLRETPGSGRDRMFVGAVAEGAPVAALLDHPRNASPWGRRFESLRALGHALLDPLRSGAVGAGSGPFAQAIRRRRSGAFAAELLLPEDALHDASGGNRDGAADEVAFGRLLESYGVGATVAAWQLWNHRWLSSPVVRDDLIARFGSRA